MTRNHLITTEHGIYKNHSFKWDKVKIFHNETDYRKRIISDMFFSKGTIDTLDTQEDARFLSSVYDRYIDDVV